MKKLLLSIFFMAGYLVAGAQQAKDFTIPVKVIASEAETAITISWPVNNNATNYTIRRKLLTDKSFATSFLTVASIRQRADTSFRYIDKNISLGELYEYEITGQFDTLLPGSRTTYVCAGIKVPAVHSRGTLILLCDNTITTELSGELKRLYEDFVGDGWKVKRIDVARSDDPHAVVAVKNKIANTYLQSPDTKYIFIVGHVPVPYSGMIVPDGHGDHVGAWAADGYYGDMQNDWTDVTVNNITAARPENRNIPGDGKFDRNSFTSVQLGVGRIDFSNLPAFSLSEVDLLKRYLNKDHLYKTAGISIKKKSLIEDNFTGYSEQFSQGGWKSGAANVGYDNVSKGAYDTLLTTNTDGSYLWSYGCGAGLYQNAWGIASTNNFATRTYYTVFTEIFGSYFGDWDSQNNLMRAATASNGSILTCVWSGRPNWFFHHMSIGMPIGYSALVTMNNTGLYANTGTNAALVHTSLMGDPTLRNSYIKPPASLQRNVVNRSVHLNWLQPAENNISGYNIYRSNSITGNFTLLNNEPISGLSFDDTLPLTGKNIYLVRTLKLDTIVNTGLYTNSSTYFNMSQAAVDSVFFSSVILPVNLLSFSGKTNGCKTELNWKISGEINIQSYILEYSSGGNEFRALGIVPANAVQNIDGSKSYQFLHEPTESSAFYRLKIIGNDGHSLYSQQVFLSAKCPQNDIVIYPLPANDFVFIKISAPVISSESTAVLSDITGRLLQKIRLQNGINSIKTAALPKGLYNLVLYINAAVKNYKIIK